MNELHIASGWRYASLGELKDEGIISEIQDGNHGERHPKSTDYVPVGVPFIMAKDLESGRLKLSDCSFIPKQLADSLRIGFAKPGDVLLTHKATMGRVAIVPDGYEYVMLTPQVTYYRIGDAEQLSNMFLKYAFLGPDFQHQLNSDSDQSTRKYIGITAQRRLRIPFPPSEEQRAIAHILSTLDDKIELNRGINETLEAITRAIFKSWFVDFGPVRVKAEGRDPGLPKGLADMFPNSLEDCEQGETPAGWEQRTVDDEFILTMGQSPPGETYNETSDGLPFYQGRADFGFRFPTQRVFCTGPTRYANAGDTLISVRAPVGDINMAAERSCIGRGVAAARHKSGSRSYTYYFMLSIKEVFDRFEAEGTVFGSISKKDFHNIQRVMPPKELIDVFEGLAAPIDERIAANDHESRTLAAVRDALLPKLISGDLHIKKAEHLVVSASRSKAPRLSPRAAGR
jgi:type I restriction enzyme S subunit